MNTQTLARTDVGPWTRRCRPQRAKEENTRSMARFVHPLPNACWHLRITEYVLIGGRQRVVFQQQVDHSRIAIASFNALREASDAALAVVKAGIAAIDAEVTPMCRDIARHELKPTIIGASDRVNGHRTGLIYLVCIS